MQHDYEWAEIAGTALTILERDTEVRTAPYTYGTRHSICIGQYTAKPHPALPIICEHRRGPCVSSFTNIRVGDGTAGKYPLCGSLQPREVRGVAEREFLTLGMEAVAEWLRINRPGHWRAERDAASEWFERYERGRLEEERRKRQERRSRRVAPNTA